MTPHRAPWPAPPRPGRRRLLGALVGAPVAAVLASAGGGARAAEPVPERRPWPARQPTPALDLPVLDHAAREGPRFRLEQARGQVVLINFWASWCEPCRSERPSLELVAERFVREGLVVVAVNHRETDAALRRFIEQMPISLPILRDVDGAASRSFGVRVYPTTVAIGRDGRAAFSVVGATEWNAEPARGWLAALLARPTPPAASPTPTPTPTPKPKPRA